MLIIISYEQYCKDYEIITNVLQCAHHRANANQEMVHVTQMMSVEKGLNVEREIAQNFLNRIVVMSQMVTISNTYYLMIDNSSKIKALKIP